MADHMVARVLSWRGAPNVLPPRKAEGSHMLVVGVVLSCLAFRPGQLRSLLTWSTTYVG